MVLGQNPAVHIDVGAFSVVSSSTGDSGYTRFHRFFTYPRFHFSMIRSIIILPAAKFQSLPE